MLKSTTNYVPIIGNGLIIQIIRFANIDLTNIVNTFEQICPRSIDDMVIYVAI